MNPTDLKTIAESLVFAAGNPISLRRLSEVIGVAQTEIKPALILLREEYEASGRGIIFAEVAGGYQLRTSPDTAEYVRSLLQEKPSKLSRAALETLSIIAYRQPVTKIEIESVRGVSVDGVLNSLLIKKLIRELGRKDVPGRPWVYGTTPQFLELFGLSDLSGLPPLPDIHEPTLNPLADDALNDTIENALESHKGSLTDTGGDPHYYAEDTFETNEPNAAPQYNLSDEFSASAREEPSDLTKQQVPEDNEDGTGPESSREVSFSPTTEHFADPITPDGDALSQRENASSPPPEEVLESGRPETADADCGSTPDPSRTETGQTGTAPQPSGKTDFHSAVEQAAEQALQTGESNWAETGQTGSGPHPRGETNEADALADDKDTLSGKESTPSSTFAQALESSRSDLAPESRDPDPSGEGRGERGDDYSSRNDSDSET